MPLHLALLTLLLHAAPATPSPYAAARFETETSTQLLSKRYVPLAAKDAEAPRWVQSKDYVPLQQQIREGTLAAPLSDADKALIRELEALSRMNGPPQGRWYTLPALSKGTPPENLTVPAYLESLLRVGDTKRTQTPRHITVPKKDPKRFPQTGDQLLSNMLLLEGSATDVKKVYFHYTVLVSDRSMSTETSHAIALFEGGKLQRVVALDRSGMADLVLPEDEENPFGIASVSVMVPDYGGGKLSRLELTRVVDSSGYPEDNPNLGISLEKTVFQAVTRS